MSLHISFFTTLVVSCLLSFCGVAVAHDDQKLDDSQDNDRIALAWIPYWDQKSAFQSYEDNHNTLTHVSFFWYYLTEEGNIERYRYAKVNSDLVAKVQSNGDKAYAIIANLPDLDPDHPDGDWNREWVRRVIVNDANRRRHIEDLVSLAIDGHFDGINIDYENLRRSDRHSFSRFISELASALHDVDKELAVALHPKSAEYKSSEDNGSHAQDWKSLSLHADQLHIMGYGEHYVTSKPGPLASVAWLANILAYLNKLDLDKDKFVLGVPLYAQLWKLSHSKKPKGIDMDTNYREIQRQKDKYGGVEEFLPDVLSNRMRFASSPGKEYVAYFENALSLAGKLALARQWGIYNVAFWRIGGEDPNIWKEIDGHRLQ